MIPMNGESVIRMYRASARAGFLTGSQPRDSLNIYDHKIRAALFRSFGKASTTECRYRQRELPVGITITHEQFQTSGFYDASRQLWAMVTEGGTIHT